MSVDVKQQIRIRGAHRAYVSKLLKRVPEVAPDDEEQIELLRISLKGKRSVLEDLDKSILELVEEGNIDKEIEESEGIKDEIHLNLLKLDSLLKELKTPSQPSEPSPVSTSSQATGSTSHSTKLPKLVLKKFSGDPKTWKEWWDSFKVAVHENGISDVEKFNHLRSLGKSWQKADLIFGSGSRIHCNYGASCKVATNSLNTKRVIKSQRTVSEKKMTPCKNHHWNG